MILSHFSELVNHSSSRVALKPEIAAQVIHHVININLRVKILMYGITPRSSGARELYPMRGGTQRCADLKVAKDAEFWGKLVILMAMILRASTV